MKCSHWRSRHLLLLFLSGEISAEAILLGKTASVQNLRGLLAIAQHHGCHPIHVMTRVTEGHGQGSPFGQWPKCQDGDTNVIADKDSMYSMCTAAAVKLCVTQGVDSQPESCSSNCQALLKDRTIRQVSIKNLKPEAQVKICIHHMEA